MLIAVISDIHANMVALSAVEKDYRSQRVDAVWLLGDVFGRGPHPQAMIKWMEKKFTWYQPRNIWVAGNHDENVFGWNGHNDYIIPPHIQEVDSEHGRVIHNNPSGVKLSKDRTKLNPFKIEKDGGDYCLRHEFPEVGYLYPWRPFTLRSAMDVLINSKRGTVILSGHTHIPLLVRDDPQTQIVVEPVVPFKTYGLDREHKWIINPGSVGAPADLDNRSSYALLDTKNRTIQIRKVAYNIQQTITNSQYKNHSKILWEQLEKAKLPDQDVPQKWIDHLNAVSNVNCDQEK